MTDKQRWDIGDKVLFDYKLRQIQPVRSKMAGNSLWISQNWGKIQHVRSKIAGKSLWISQNSGKIQPVRSKIAGFSLWIRQNSGKIQPVRSKIAGNFLWISQNSSKIQSVRAKMAGKSLRSVKIHTADADRSFLTCVCMLTRSQRRSPNVLRGKFGQLRCKWNSICDLGASDWNYVIAHLYDEFLKLYYCAIFTMIFEIVWLCYL